MAQETLKKLEDQLICSICLDTYNDPKQLQCFHLYCQKCLFKLVVQDQWGQLSLTCPTCRQVTPLPANGVAGLQSAFNIIPILEIQDSFKKLQDSSATLEAGAVGGATDVTSVKKASLCFEHGTKALELYCETCQELICFKCAIKGGKHHSHDYVPLSEAFEKYKGEITPSLETMEEQLATINEALAQLDTHCGEISNQQAPIETKIHDAFRRIHETLNVRETRLISQLHQIIHGKLKGLAAQRDQIEATQVKLSSSLDTLKKSFEASSQEQMLMKTAIEKQVKELSSIFQSDMLKSNAEANIIFSASADIIAVCQNYGQVSLESALPDPSKCHATIKNMETTAVGEKSTAFIQAINCNGQPCVEPIESLECELVSDITGTRARSSIERKGEDQYKISYQPSVKGRHQLHIKVKDHHIRGSPFCVVAKSPVKKLGTPICMIDGVRRLLGIAINQRGELVVTESFRDCVSVFSSSGKKLQQFGSRHGQFNHPRGVAVDGEENILVVDGNHRIQKFTAEGDLLASVGTEGKGPLQFRHPYSIAFNTSNNKVYVGDANCHIQVLNSDLTFSSIFGKEGSGKGQFRGELHIACDSTGKVYVADSDNHCIQVFAAEGKFFRMFGKRGEGRGELDYPAGIAVDTNGLVYVSEINNNRVSVFTSKGQFVTSFGREGNGPGEFDHPLGLAVDNSGVVYVCDSANNRIQVF